MIEALESSLGVVTSACKKVGIGRTIFYEWLKTDEEFRKAVKDIENIALDFAESQLHQQIKSGNSTSTIFYLKTKGKSRGYVERMDLGFEATPSKIVIQVAGEEPEMKDNLPDGSSPES